MSPYESLPWEGSPEYIRAGNLNLIQFRLSCLCSTGLSHKLDAETYVVDGIVLGTLHCAGCRTEYSIEIRASIKTEAAESGPYRFRRVPDYNV